MKHLISIKTLQRSSGSGTLANHQKPASTNPASQYPSTASPSPTARSTSLNRRSLPGQQAYLKSRNMSQEHESKANWRRRVKFAGTQFRICGNSTSDMREKQGELKVKARRKAVKSLSNISNMSKIPNITILIYRKNVNLLINHD